MVELSDLRTDSWTQIAALLEAGGRPKISDLSAALRRGELVPKRAQDHIAALLTGEVRRKRGRHQALPDGENPKFYPFKKQQKRDLDEQFLIIAVAQLAKEKQDQSDPIQSAIEKIAPSRRVDASTLRRYYTKARARWPEYVALADES
jgi:hypothetical protein